MKILQQLRGRNLQYQAFGFSRPHPPLPRSPFPYEGKVLKARLAMSGATLSYCGERSVAALPGGAKPFVGRVGWRGLPLRTINGADSGFRRTASIYPRRAKRRAQVCGDSTVQSDGRWAGSPHPPLTRSPFPYEGKALTPLNVSVRPGWARHFPYCGEVTFRRVGQGNMQSPAPGLAPHPPLTRSPFPS